MKIFKVLLAEDDLSAAKLVSHTLKKYNFDLTHAENGRDAAEIALKEPFDLVMTDVNMPYMDGFQFLEATKDILKNTPVIMLTAVGDREKVVKATAYNVQMFLLKPINPSKLTEKISEALKLNPGQIILKKDFPFKINYHILDGDGMQIALSGIPGTDFTEDVISLVSDHKSKTKFIRIQADKELFYYPKILLTLDTILFRLQKEFSISLKNIEIHGSLFSVVSNFDSDEYRCLHLCRISEFF